MTLRVFDCHIHIQPWEQLHPAVLQTMIRGRSDGARLERILAEPAELLRLMDEEEVERAALINYVAPEVMGFTSAANSGASGARPAAVRAPLTNWRRVNFMV